MKSASRFNLIAMAIVSAILFQSNNLSASQPPVSSLSTDVQEWVDAYNAALEKYPYICGGIIKWNITQWETSDFVVLTGAEHWNGKTDQDYYELTAYKIWLAQYNTSVTYTASRYDLWQYSEKGSISGINGNVDLDRSYLGY